MVSKQDIKKDILKASKEKDEIARIVFRGLLSEIEKREIELGRKEEGLDEEEIGKIVLSEIKKRKEARAQYERGGRGDLADNEKKESEVLARYAPEQLSDEELNKLIDDTIKEKGVSGMQDMGQVMKEVIAKAGMGADGSRVSELVRKKLQNV